uniref:Uncharacterized protein n=1 Tax=Tanacetum cinerariifolium TaxID=118510 RepID=A0A6L2L4U5_TANCI|nr:hypothetical protein [Tanacetum cinerariifolium]
MYNVRPQDFPSIVTDDSEADSESEAVEQRPERHESLKPSFEFPLAPVVALPGIRQRLVILVRPSEATHPNGPHSSSYGSSSDSSSYTFLGSSLDSLSKSSSVHSSRCDASGQSHSGPSTKVASPRFIFTFCWTISQEIQIPYYFGTIIYHVSRSIASTHVDLLPPCKRFRDSYSSKDSGEKHMEIGTTDAETNVDLG